MDIDGYRIIEQAFVGSGVEATITPQPEEGEDARFVTVETDETVQPSRVLNALSATGLVFYDGLRDGGGRRPSLEPVSVQPGSLTFEDRNDANRPMWG